MKNFYNKDLLDLQHKIQNEYNNRIDENHALKSERINLLLKNIDADILKSKVHQNFQDDYIQLNLIDYLPRFQIQQISEIIIKNKGLIIRKENLCHFLKVSIIQQYKFFLNNKQFTEEYVNVLIETIVNITISNLKKFNFIEEFYGYKNTKKILHIKFFEKFIKETQVEISKKKILLFNKSQYGNCQIDVNIYKKFTNDKSIKTLYSKEIIKNINYLQSIPFKIDKEKLEKCYDSLEELLRDENEFSINDYRNVIEYRQKMMEITKDISPNPAHDLRYRKNLNRARKVIETVFLMNKFINQKYFYLQYFGNFRGQLYLNENTLLHNNITITDFIKSIDNMTFETYEIFNPLIQIIGLLFYKKNYLEQTNLIGTKKNDVYTYLLKKLELEQYFTRDQIKSITMTYLYNKSYINTYDRVRESLYNNLNKEFNSKTVNQITKKLREDLSKEFSVITNFNKFIVSKIQKPLQINNLFFVTEQFYVCTKNQYISFYDHNQKFIKVPVKIDLYPYKLFSAKTKKITLLNLIHNLLETLIHMVIKDFRKNDKPIIVKKDHSFVVTSKDQDFLKETYIKNIKLLFFEQTPLLNFIKDNDIIVNSQELEIFISQKENILNELTCNLNKNFLKNNDFKSN